MFTWPKVSLSGERIFISFSPVLASKTSVTNFECNKNLCVFKRLYLPPIMVWTVSKSYYKFFFFTLATLFFERWFGGPAGGVCKSFLLKTKYSRSFCSETQVTVPKNNSLWKVPSWLFGHILKNTFEWIE